MRVLDTTTPNYVYPPPGSTSAIPYNPNSIYTPYSSTYTPAPQQPNGTRPSIVVSHTVSTPSLTNNASIGKVRQGQLRIDAQGHAWVMDPSNQERPVYIAPDSLNGAIDGDHVLTQLHNRSDNKLSGVIVRILSRHGVPHQVAPHSPSVPPNPTLSQFVDGAEYEGTIKIDNNGYAFVVVESIDEIVTIPRELTLGARDGDRVIITILGPYSSNNNIVGAVRRVLNASHPSPPTPPLASSSNPAPTAQPPFPPSNISTPPSIPRSSSHLQISTPPSAVPTSPNVVSTQYMSYQYHLKQVHRPHNPPHGATVVSASVWPPPPPGSGATTAHSPPVPPNGPPFLRMSPQEKEALKQQYAAIDKENRGVLSKDDLRVALGLVGFDKDLAKLFFKAFDLDGDNVVSKEDFLNVMAIMLKGTPQEKIQIGANMVDIHGNGRITIDNLYKLVESLYRVLTNMRIPLYASDMRGYVSALWRILDVNGVGFITKEEYKVRALANAHMFIGLGLVDVPPDPPKLPKRGIAVSVGHFYWSLVLQMMVGMRLAVEAAPKDLSYQLTAADFNEIQLFELSSNDFAKKYVFTDHAPAVFRRIRQLSGIDEKAYMYSLGPEQLLGNFMLGNLSSLSMSVSDGKSGSFFFTSHDGRFLVKTISDHEKATLRRILPSYYRHLSLNPHTMLCRIYGFHAINNTTFIVMGNVFSTHLQIDQLYDLKGSTVGRSGTGSVKKDLDFTRVIRLGSYGPRFLHQLRIDASYLQSENLIDYSLLLGIRQLTEEEMRNDNEKVAVPVVNGVVPLWAEYKGGMRGYDEYGRPSNEVFFVGIIDILTEFGLTKKAENFLKSFIHSPDQISAVPPDHYKERFCRYIESLVK